MTASGARPNTGKNRQLVVYEANPTNPNYGEMVALAPGDAAGIALPTFQVGPARPTAGTTQGEGFYETSTRTGSVWDGAAWVPVTPRAEIEQWEATKSYALNEIVTDRGMIWIAKIQTPIGNQPQEPSSIWRLLGSPGLVKITSICHATDGLDSVPKVEGAQALDRSTGQVYTYINNQWVELLGGYYGATGTQPTTAQQISFNRGDTPTWPAGTTDLQAAIRLIYQQLAASASIASAPQIGEIKMFASLTIPAGWQLCDGSTIDPSKAAAIALLGASTPDMRSQFPRGWDAGHTPLAREAAATGAPSGGNPSATGVSLAVTGTTNTTGAHSHTNACGAYMRSDGGPNWNSGRENDGTTSTNGDHQHTVTGTATGTVTVNTGWDTETRPANVRVVYAIYVG